ncbi:MAG: hypothetical protein QNJ51_02775 [Calothrix sp. MO_167.B12]|nr:hypothetical protein [Calothrix sp. MO_167.B12]
MKECRREAASRSVGVKETREQISLYYLLLHHPITPSPHHPITPSPHHPITTP